jgi:tetratricopeptide (TPR) repeat protein
MSADERHQSGDAEPAGSLPRATDEWLRRGILALASLLLAAIPSTFSIQLYDQFELPQELLLRLIIPGMLALWLARLRGARAWVWQRTPLDIVLVLWAAWLLIKTALSVSPVLSWRGEYDNHDGTLTQLHYIALYFLLTQHLRHGKEARGMIRAAVLGGGVACIYILFQASGLDFLSWSVSFHGVGRFSGTLGNPLAAGTLAMMAAPLAFVAFAGPVNGAETRRGLLALAAASGGGMLLWSALLVGKSGGARFVADIFAAAGKPSFWVLLLFFILTLAGAVSAHRGHLAVSRLLACCALSALFLRTLLESGSRGATLGLAGGALAALIIALAGRRLDVAGTIRTLRSGNTRMLLPIGIAAGVIAVAVIAVSNTSTLSRIAESIRDPARAYAESRVAIWRPALHMWRARPVAGWGVDSFMTVSPAFQSGSEVPEGWKGAVSQTAHCEPLHVLATLGLVGFGLWVSLFVLWFRAVHRRLGVADDDAWLLMVGACAVVVAYQIQALVGITAVPIRAILWSLLALPLAIPPTGRGPDSALPDTPPLLHPPRWFRATLWPIALGLICVAAASVASTYWADLRHNVAEVRFRWTEDLGRTTAPPPLAQAALEMASLERGGFGGDSYLAGQFRELKTAATWLGAASQRGLESPEMLRTMQRNYVALVFLLRAAHSQEESVRLAPHELRYLAFLGQLYTELYHWSAAPEWQARWFERAESLYRRADALNSHNAFTQANHARLWYLRHQRGGEAVAFGAAERLYLRAHELAPANRQFIADLVALYLSAGRLEAPLQIASRIEARDPRMAGVVLLDLGTQLAALSEIPITRGASPSGAGTSARALALQTLRSAGQLRPDLAEVPYRAAVIHCAAAENELCRSYLAQALAIDPRYAPAQALRQSKGW